MKSNLETPWFVLVKAEGERCLVIFSVLCFEGFVVDSSPALYLLRSLVTNLSMFC